MKKPLKKQSGNIGVPLNPGDVYIGIPRTNFPKNPPMNSPKQQIKKKKPIQPNARPMLPGYVYPMADTSGSNLADYKKNRNIKKK